MDQDAWIDSVLDPDVPVADDFAGSSQDDDVTLDPAQVDPEAVAPSSDETGADSSTLPDHPTNTNTPDETAARLAALETQLAQASEKAQRLDWLEQQAQAHAQQAAVQAEQQRRAAQEADWAERATKLEELPPEYQKREAARLLAEVNAANAQRVIPQLQQVHSEAEDAAKVASSFIHALDVLPDDLRQQVFDTAQHLRSFDSPEGQQQARAHDKRVADAAIARFKAEQDKSQVRTTAQRAQQRVANGTDLVGIAPGGTGPADDGSADFLLDQKYRQAFGR